MSDAVWFSQAQQLTIADMNTPLDSDVLERDVDSAVEVMDKNDRGEILPPDVFPKKLWADDDETGFIEKLPDFFLGGGHWCVSAKCAAVLQQFDLGGGQLIPLEIFQKDRKTHVEGVYFCIMVAISGNKWQ